MSNARLLFLKICNDIQVIFCERRETFQEWWDADLLCLLAWLSSVAVKFIWRTRIRQMLWLGRSWQKQLVPLHYRIHSWVWFFGFFFLLFQSKLIGWIRCTYTSSWTHCCLEKSSLGWLKTKQPVPTLLLLFIIHFLTVENLESNQVKCITE